MVSICRFRSVTILSFANYFDLADLVSSTSCPLLFIDNTPEVRLKLEPPSSSAARSEMRPLKLGAATTFPFLEWTVGHVQQVTARAALTSRTTEPIGRLEKAPPFHWKFLFSETSLSSVSKQFGEFLVGNRLTLNSIFLMAFTAEWTSVYFE